MILVLLAECITGGIHSEKLGKIHYPIIERVTTKLFGNNPSTQGTYGDEYQACSSRVLWIPNDAAILPRVGSEKEQ